MKTLRISDDTHEKLTSLVGELTAQSGRMQTYADAILELLESSVLLPKDLLAEVSCAIREGEAVGYTTREDFIRDAVRRRLDEIRGEYEYIVIPRKDYEALERAFDESGAPYRNVADFISTVIDDTLAKYEDWKRERELEEKKQ